MFGRLGRLYRAQFHALRGLRPSLIGILWRIVASAIASLLALVIATWLAPGVSEAGQPRVIFAVIVLGALDVVVRPMLLALALPLGLFAVGLLGLLFRIIAFALVLPAAGYQVDGFLSVLFASLIYGAVLTAVGGLLGMTDEDSFAARTVAQVIRDEERAPATDVPGTLMVQIDGLAAPLLGSLVRAGNLPTLSRWIRDGTHRMTEWTALLPPQTSASQAGLLLGHNDGIPAFRWYEKEPGRLLVSNHPKDAVEIERRLSRGDGLLAGGGASIDNLFSGDAAINRLTMSKLEGKRDPGATRSLYYFLLNPYGLARMLVRTLAEAVKEVYQASQQRQRGIVPRMHRGGSYPFLRAATNVAMRDLNLALVTEQMLRGTPSIYVDFVDYDEIAHHSGPERIESIHALEGVDRALARFERLVEDCPRPYRIVVLSDHGQSQGATFRQRYGETVEEWLRTRMAAGAVKEATEPTEQWGHLSAVLTEVSEAEGPMSTMARRALKGQTRDGVVELGPMQEQREEAAPDAEPLELVVCASGNLALVYLPRVGTERLTIEEIEAAYPSLVADLAAHDGVGLVLVQSAAEGGAMVLGSGGSHRLADGHVEGSDPLLPFGDGGAMQMRHLDGLAHVGDLSLISRIDPGTDEVAAFEELIGSHGGLGGWQTRATLVYPSEWPEPEGPLLGAPAVHRQLKAWMAGTSPQNR
jgi:uncharacterized membrane protein YvlD (DUF360 family)